MRSEPFSDFLVRVRSQFVYYMEYNGTKPCLDYELYDGVITRAYNFIIKRTSEKVDGTGTPAGAISVKSLNDLKAAKQSAYFLDSATKELHVSLRISSNRPLDEPSGQKNLGIGRDLGSICF